MVSSHIINAHFGIHLSHMSFHDTCYREPPEKQTRHKMQLYDILESCGLDLFMPLVPQAGEIMPENVSYTLTLVAEQGKGKKKIHSH